MPKLGLGVWKMGDGPELNLAVDAALACGYRHFDTASFYKNEHALGKALGASSIPRQEIFITTKVWNEDQGYDATLKAFDQSLQLLKSDYIDLYLVHWPIKGKYLETWRALESLYKKGFVKAIGVSNFLEHHLVDLLAHATIKPMVNQLEHHPYLVQPSLQECCKANQIQFEAWSPLMQGEVFEIPLLKSLAKKYGKTIAQIVLRWNVQNEIVTIPKSIHPKRIAENAAIWDFEITKEDMWAINQLDQNKRVGPDPDVFVR